MINKRVAKPIRPVCEIIWGVYQSFENSTINRSFRYSEIYSLVAVMKLSEGRDKKLLFRTRSFTVVSPV